ncbi:DUF1127 domain-containing protein [Pseudomonas wadenswilerensis]|jgi:uncharacterized protein YjiS (DUF1127 family)|nr:DUF1127 domain-containing protein [Pseudomonas wadenswilerensis]MCE5981415.1 DUF1127 domain-containing protein [Pseudomonas sp. LF19]UVM20529.1 DUF1127 domain-containing protein [Pseudomonas wadenswilerensis]
MYDIRNIRWIDLMPGLTLSSSQQEGKTMKGQKSLVLQYSTSRHSWFHQFTQGFSQQLTRWRQLHRERRELARLSDAALDDIGLSRADILREVERPFWDDPLRK